jgi:ParB family transcriptional regulator, chromosome partitioning protein
MKLPAKGALSMIRDVQINTNIEAFLATNPEPTSPTNPTIQTNETLETAPVRFVPVDHIVPNPHQPRRQFEEAALRELADSIQEHGILQPLLVRSTGLDRYALITGERRLRAAKLLGLETVPVIVREMTDREQAEVALIENLQREDLSPVETARAFRTLMKEFGLSQKELSERVGKSPATISLALRLLNLPNDILDSLERGELHEGHARLLLRIDDIAFQKDIWQQVVAQHLSVRETEKRIRNEQIEKAELSGPAPQYIASPKMESVRKDTPEVLFDGKTEHRFTVHLSQKLSTQVMIRRSVARGGVIEIGFYDNADLLRLSQILIEATK